MRRLCLYILFGACFISSLFCDGLGQDSHKGKIYGVGYAKYSTAQSSRAAAESRAITDLAKNVNDYLEAVGSEANSTFFYNFMENNGKQIVEYAISGFKTEESGTDEDGQTYVVVSIEPSHVASSVRKVAESNTAAINADIQKTEEDFAEALAELTAMADAMKNHYETLMSDYSNQLDETDPEKVYEIFTNAILSR